MPRNLVAPLRAAYRRARVLVTRVLHPLRRRRAWSALRGAGVPRSVLVLCHGNVCRSPYLEVVLRRELRAAFGDSARFVVRSAGFVGPDRAVPRHAYDAAHRRGIDLGAHRSRIVDAGLAAGADLLVVMDVRQARAVRALAPTARSRVVILGDLDPEIPESRVVLDPWKGDSSAFEISFDRIDRCTRALVSALATGARTTATAPAPGARGLAAM